MRKRNLYYWEVGWYGGWYEVVVANNAAQAEKSAMQKAMTRERPDYSKKLPFQTLEELLKVRGTLRGRLK